MPAIQDQGKAELTNLVHGHPFTESKENPTMLLVVLVHLRTAVQKMGYTKNKALASIRFLIISEKSDADLDAEVA